VQPGERITLIKKIAGGMADVPPDEQVLVLDQFGLTLTRSYDANLAFDAFRDVVGSIATAPDSTLLALHEYVFGEAAPSPGRESHVEAEGVWDPDKFRLFVSHTSAHRTDVGACYLRGTHCLADAGFP